jgi:branched-chain amino acid transport system permease protein
MSRKLGVSIFRLKDRRILGIAFIVVIGAIVPHFIPEALIYILGLTFLFAVLAVSWDLIVGYAGQINLGHTVFVGVGAYTAALLQVPSRFEGTGLEFLANMPIFPIPLSILAGGITAAIIGFAVGIITLRLKGWYFALVTAVLPLVFIQTTFIWSDIFGGEEGFSIGLERALAPTTLGKYYAALAIMLISVIAMLVVANSRVGLKFKTVREDADLAEAVGINTTNYKVLAFVISAFFAGIAGASMMHYMVTVGQLFYDVPLMLLIILAAVIGGLGTIFGPIVGAFIVYLTKFWWLKGALPLIAATGLPLNDDMILYAMLIVIAILAPGGLWSKIEKFTKRIRVSSA